MLERLAAWFLNTYVAEYVGNLNTDQLSIGILSGAVELEKLILKKDALHKLRLPVEVKCGYIGKLRLEVPVRYIKSQPWVVQIDQLYMIAGPLDLEKFDAEEEKMAAQARKRAKLFAMEQNWKEEQQRGGSSWFWSSFASSFTSTIAENLQVTINDIHLRYEDPEVGRAKPLVIGMMIEQLTSQSTDENWVPQFTSGGDKSYKIVNISNISAYWDEELLGDLEGDDFIEGVYRKGLSVMATQDMMSSSVFTGYSHPTRHLVKPFSAQGLMTRNCSSEPLKISSGPRINMDIKLDEILVSLDQGQFASFISLSKAFKLRFKSQHYRHIRPKVPLWNNARTWWSFAIECVLIDIRKKRKSLSLDFALTRAKQCVAYVSAYTDHLTQGALDQERQDILDETEREMRYEEVAILRRLVMQRIEKERALAAEVAKVSTDDQRGIIGRWFPGWAGPASSGDAPASIDDSFEDIDEEELMEELGLDEDANSKLMRDRIFAQVSFSLSRGSLQLLVPEEDEDSCFDLQLLVEVELTGLSCHVDYRPRLKYSSLEVLLGGVTVYDHYQDDAVFSNLVKPKCFNSDMSLSSLQRSIKFTRTSSSNEVFKLQFIQQQHQLVGGYSLHVMTRPLEVVYNKGTISRLEEFFTVARTTLDNQTAARISSGLMGGVDHAFLDNLTIKLDISAPHILIPRDSTNIDKPMVVVDLGHLTFENVCDSSRPESATIEDSLIISEIIDIDDDDEFMTPPSSPPSEAEAEDVDLSTPVQGEGVKASLDKSSSKGRGKGYILKLSEIQILVGNYNKLQEAFANKTKSSLHLLDQFSLLVEVQREMSQIDLIANLPLLHFHLDEDKIHTLICCFVPPNTGHTPSHSSTNVNDRSIYMSIFERSISVYKSAPTCNEGSHDDHMTQTTTKHLNTKVAHLKLLQGQMNINEVLCTISCHSRPITEVKVISMRGGMVKRPYDISGRFFIQDLFVVDRLQTHGPQFELLVSSSGHGLDVSRPCDITFGDNILGADVPYMVDVRLMSLTSLSPDHPSVMVDTQGGWYHAYDNHTHIHKLDLHCTAVDVIANQRLMVEWIALFQTSVPSYLFKSTIATSIATDAASIAAVVATTTSHSIEVSLELERLVARVVRGGRGQEEEPSKLTASIDINGLGVHGQFGSKMNIEGCLDGVKVTDLTSGNDLNVISLGSSREGRDLDMVTTMLTSYDSLKKLGDSAQFAVARLPRTSPAGYEISMSVPSILYTHSMDFIHEMELFALDFLKYFDDITGSMKTAAMGVARGLVQEKSKLADHLNRLSFSLGGVAQNHHDNDDTDDGGVASKQANRILLNVLVKSPVVVLPCGNAGLQDSFVLHLGEITVKNSFKTLDSCSLDEGEFPLTSNEWEELILKVSNVTVHSSHDSASRDWLISEIKDETPTVCGRWTKIVKETSFLFQVERAMSPEGVMTTPLKENMVDVRISCQFLSSVYLVLPNEVIEMAKTMFKNSLYKPVNDVSKGGTSGASPRKTSISTAEDHDVIMTSSENLPKLFANFKLPGLSIELKHMVGSKEKDIVFISLDNFYVRCHKTTPHHAYYELALKQVVVEDLLQSDELYRYIFSSTNHPFPFKSRSPSFLLSNSLGGMGSPVSSPQQPVHSPLTTFDPFSDTTPTPRPAETTPTAETSTDIISIKGFYVSSEHPEFNTKYNNISIHTSIAFSSLYLIINLQTWVLVFDYLGIGVPTPPTSPPEPVDIAFDDTPMFPSDGLELFSLKPDGSIYINQGGVDRSRSGSVATETSPERSDIQKGTVWGVEGKISAHVELKVPSLTVTCNKLDHPLARGTANQLTAELTMSQGNLKCCGSFGKATLIDLTETGSYYRERITTSDHSLTFDVFKFGRKDLEMVRPYDISVTLQVSSVRYLHTMRFLKEMLAFCLHFPQLLEAFQRMKAVSRGNLQYTPDRKPRILFEIDVDKPMILIPKHAFSPELMGGVIKHLTLSNKFLYDGDNGTLSHRGKVNISRVRSTPAGLESTGSDRRGSLPRKHSILDNLSKFNTDKEMIEELLKGEGPCLLDCMELILREVDVFSARKAPLGNHSLLDGYQYMFKRDEGEVLKEQVTVKLAIERNLFDDFCRAAPDLHIDGKISAVHMMLDKRQLEIIKGFVEMNLGEEIEDFEKPSSVIHDPIVQPLVATVWINFRFHVEFVGVQLEFLQWRASSLIPSSVTHSLALFDIQLSEFTFESYSDQSKSVDFTSHAVIAHDTRYAGFPQAEKPNVFEEVLKARLASDEATPTKSLQFELHVVMTPTQTKASVLLNKLRLIGVVNLLMELKEFVIDKLPDEEEGMDSLIEEDVDFDDNLLRNVITAHVNKLSSHNAVNNDTNKVDKDVKIGLSITDTDLVIVEDLANSSSNAVVLKGTVVLNFRSPPKSEGLPTLHCSIDGLELFSCCVSHEDDTALSILDPVSIGIELKPVQPPQSGTHSLEVDIRQVNIRVSYNDIKLFLNILQNLQLETLRDKADTEIKHQITYTNEKIVKLLLPLGFSRTAILRVLKRNDGDINETALQLVLEEKEKQEKNDNSMKLNSLEVLMGSLNMCLIDDYLNHDVPLLELTLSTLQATNSISSVVEGKSLTTLSLDYYNRNISSWEPIIEPWKLQLMWHKISQFCTDLDTNEKPDRISLKITSPEILNINLTTSLLHLLKETQTSWLADVQIDNTTSGLSQDDKEKQLLKLRNKAAGNDRSIHQGLSLLHSVRFISQSRQRSKYIPFALSNSTGLPLRFATLTSLPSKVLFTSSLQQSSSSTFNVMLKAPDNWTYVQPGEEMPFDFVSRQKIRHKDTRALVVHQLRVQVDGWEEINIPISVDKIGIFFRDIKSYNGGGTVRLFFAISLKETRKIVNVRSGVVIYNSLELPMEIKVDPSSRGSSSVSLPLVNPMSYTAVPIHLIDRKIRVRPQGWGLNFCAQPLSWQHSVHKSNDVRQCESTSQANIFRFGIQVTQEIVNNEDPTNCLITLVPSLTVVNLLPFGFYFSCLNKETFVPNDKQVSVHTVDCFNPISFSLSRLESFEFSEDCTISTEEVGMIKQLVLRDKSHRPLSLCVLTESVSKGSLKISIFCMYWLINRTGLPLVFASQGDPNSDIAAGQYEEHEEGSQMTPLLFAYSENDLMQRCQVRLGKRFEGQGHPSWSLGFRMLNEGGVMRLFIRRGEGRPDKEYQIGMEIKKGSGRYRLTKLVTFVARFQLENKTPFHLGYLQRHLVPKENLLMVPEATPKISPHSNVAFHWPRPDFDQLLCVKVVDLPDSYWSGGFPLEQDKSFHINMRRTFGRSVFIRCEIIQRGATYHVMLSDASNYPPPFKLENLSQVSISCYQHGISQNHQYTTLNPGQSVPYSWDEVTLNERLCVHVNGSSEPRRFDLSLFGPQGKVYYESYFYIIAMDTKTDQSNPPRRSLEANEEMVLDVPQGKAVILTRKSSEKRSQLWRMTADGQLVHVVSSTHSANYVLDLSQPLFRSHGNELIPLMISRSTSKRTSTQTWEFKDKHLILSDYPNLCVQCRHGYESKMEGGDAVVGPMGGQGNELFYKVKKSPGSGVLSVAVVPNGPTRVLKITDENKKYTHSIIQDDWIIVDNGIVAPANTTNVDPVPLEDEIDIKNEISVSLSLENGFCISLINSVPEELILATVTGIQLEFEHTVVHQCLTGSIQYLQVDNQMLGGYNSIIVFPTPSEVNYPVVSCFIERLPHESPLAVVFRTVEVKVKHFTVLLEEKLLFKLLQWSGIGTKERESSQHLLLPTRSQWVATVPNDAIPSHQLYIEQLHIHTTELLVNMHTSSQLPSDLMAIKKRLGFPLIQFESPIHFEGFHKFHMLGTPVLYMDAITKHYKKVIQGQAVRILGSVDFLGNPTGLLSDVASGVQGMLTTQPDVVGLVCNVAHGMSDTTSKLTGTVSHVLGHATGDSTFLEEREQNLESCQTSGDHFKAGLINLTSGIFGGVTSILTQPYKGAVEDGMGGFIWGIGKGVVGTIVKPVTGVLDFASGTTAALRETMSQVSRQIPSPMRTRRCCIDATGAISCYSVQLARGQDYLLQLNDGDISEKLISYEKFPTSSGEIRIIISSKCLYFFKDSPPDVTSLTAHVRLDLLVECSLNEAKSTIPSSFIVLTLRDDSNDHRNHSKRSFKCTNESTARKIVQLINYAKNLFNEEKMIIRTLRLQNITIW